MEVTQTNTGRKLNMKWKGPYRVVEVLRNGGAYVLTNVFTGQEIQRAAEKVKLYNGSEKWLVGAQEINFPEEEDEPVPPRVRRPPCTLIE